MLHDATWRNRGMQADLIDRLGVVNLPSRQVVPRGAVKAGMPGCRTLPFGRVPVEIILASGKAPLQGQGQKGRSGLAWPFAGGCPGRQKSGSHHSSTKLKLEPSHPDQSFLASCFGHFQAQSYQRLIAGSYANPFLYLSYSPHFLLYPSHNSLREFARVYDFVYPLPCISIDIDRSSPASTRPSLLASWTEYPFQAFVSTLYGPLAMQMVPPSFPLFDL